MNLRRHRRALAPVANANGDAEGKVKPAAVRFADGVGFILRVATREKCAALRHFEPEVSLITRGAQRRPRRKFNDEALESHRAFHRLAETLAGVVREEAGYLLHALEGGAALT